MSNLENCFKVAFGVFITGLQGVDDVPLSVLYDALWSNPGSIRKKAQELVQSLTGHNWTWPYYEEIDFNQRLQEREETIRIITNEPKAVFLSRLTVPQLRSIISTHGGTLNKGANKKDYILKVEQILADNQIENIKSEFIGNISQPSVRSRKHVAEALATRIEGLMYQLARWESLQETVDFLPYWELKIQSPENATEECRIHSDTILHYTDRFWASYSPVCLKINCSCYIIPHSERDFKKAAKLS